MARRRKFTVRIHDKRGGYTSQLVQDEQAVSLLILTAFEDPHVDHIEIEKR